VRLRARIVPGWDGAPARLAEAVLALALLIWLSELLGAVGLFREASFLVSCALVGAGSWFLRPAPAGPKPPAPPAASLAVLVAVGVIALLFAHWGFETKKALNNGIGNFDSLWYHMPFSADMVQSGSLTGLHFTDPLFLNWFYPQNSETVHAVGILLLGGDQLSLFINLGWLGLTLLAAWCVGRPFGRGPIAVVAAALLLEAHTLVVREPGAAKNDVVGTALLLSCCALLLNGWLAQRADGRQQTADGRAAPLAGALALAGLAAGLAIGTKLTVAAAVAALTVGVVVLAPRGGRWRALLTWFAPLLAGGVFWYLRNMVKAGGNPLPWVRHLGPISLPAPERLQEARPSFSIAHYATDTHIWRAYFAPGVHEAFGFLWPVVILAGIAGAAIALWRGREPIVRLLGAVALFAMAAYLFTPLGAAGQDGMPVAFAINIRFLVPSLILGLVLLAAVPGLERGNRGWWLLGGLLVVLVITDRSDAALRAPERAFGVLVAVLLVLVPALLLYLRARGTIRGAWLAAGLAAVAAAVVAIGYPVQRDYFHDRWRNFDAAQHMDTAYRWARNTEGTRIGLAGTTAGFLEYGFFGRDDSNRVRYLGREGDDGAFSAIPSCSAFRAAVNDGGFDYVVTAPFLNFNHPDSPIASPEGGWIRTDPAVRPFLRDGPVTVWRIRGSLDPAGCARLKVPAREVPRQS
jgi:hypothetical protein